MRKSNANFKNLDNDSSELFSMLRVPWSKAKSEVWEDTRVKMKPRSVIPLKPRSLFWQVSVAAAVVITFGLGLFMKTYTTTVQTLTAQHLSTQLPDGSSVDLNAGSEISYHPYWWMLNRKVNLKGEAFFEVEKGSKFSVESSVGITEVLGTSFNILARNQRYEVTCFTGEVRVQAVSTSNSVILHPKEKAILRTGQLEVDEVTNVEDTRAWLSNKIVFTSVLLKEVFQEIERQYSVKISVPQGLTQVYTGSFDKNESLDNILKIICRPFELSVHKSSATEYRIDKK